MEQSMCLRADLILIREVVHNGYDMVTHNDVWLDHLHLITMFPSRPPILKEEASTVTMRQVRRSRSTAFVFSTLFNVKALNS